MKTIISGHKVSLKDDFKNLAEKKLARFDKLFDDNALATVTVTVEKNRQTVEITIKHNSMVYRAEFTTLDMFESLDKAIEALSKQFRKHKSRLEKRLRKESLEDYFSMLSTVEESDIPEDSYKIVKTKRFFIKPIDVEEAILEMNMIGHQFYMFRNQETDEINVIYRRNDGNYGLLAPDLD